MLEAPGGNQAAGWRKCYAREPPATAGQDSDLPEFARVEQRDRPRRCRDCEECAIRREVESEETSDWRAIGNRKLPAVPIPNFQGSALGPAIQVQSGRIGREERRLGPILPEG